MLKRHFKKALIFTILPIVLIIIFFIVMLSSVGGFFSQQNNSPDLSLGDGQLSTTVEGYQPIVEEKAKEAGIEGYENLILAVMEVESGGTGLDPMQCSESPLNKRYPNVPDGIADPYYSIEIGIKYLASCLRAAKCTSPSDIDKIALAVQGYNYGNGYIAWAVDRDGGYTAENAQAFSDKMKKRLGTSVYGNPQYAEKVLSYYTGGGSTNGNGEFGYPLAQGTFRISSPFGNRTDPIGGGSEFHKGIDFAASEGTPIYASAAGTVIFAEYGRPPYSGYGYVVVLKNSARIITLYGHCSRLFVSANQSVRQGQKIAEVGHTGEADGNHCHFEIRINNTPVDPMPYLQGTSHTK